MSVYIESLATGESLDIGASRLSALFRIAKHYGWEHSSGDLELIKAKDTKSLAEAIRRALADLEQDTRIQVWSLFTPDFLRQSADFFEKGKVRIS